MASWGFSISIGLKVISGILVNAEIAKSIGCDPKSFARWSKRSNVQASGACGLVPSEVRSGRSPLYEDLSDVNPLLRIRKQGYPSGQRGWSLLTSVTEN